MTGGLGAVAAGRHVTPATTAILGAVEEDPATAWIVAAAHATKFAGNQRIGAVVDDGHHERGKRIATSNKVARVGAIGRQLKSTSAGASTQHAIDLGHRVGAGVVGYGAVFSERPQCASNPSRVQQSGSGARRLLFGASHDCNPAVMIDDADRIQPLEHRAEVPQCVAAHAKLDVVRVDEIEPEAIADEYERAAISRWNEESGHGDLL